MKRALVLAGGGTKGAYEAGFLKALHELGIQVDIVTGTSIGALNGCLYAQGGYEDLQHLWDIMDVNQLFAGDFNEGFNFDIDDMLDQSNLVLSFFKKYIQEKGADITPLKNTMRNLLNEDQLLTSPIDFGLCTVNYPSLKPLFITKNEMEKEYIFDYLVASASCFPVLPLCNIKENQYIDGGYYDNLPIDLAFEMGADEVLVVDMKYEGATHPHYLNRPHVTYTRPYDDLGNFLDFDKNVIERNRRLGYQVAMKKFGHFVGVRYTFEPFETEYFERFYREVLYIERSMRTMFKNDSRGNLINKFMDSHKGEPLELNDYLYITLDWFMELLDKDPSEVYCYEDIIQELLNVFDEYTHEDFQMISLKGTEELLKSFKNVSKTGIIGTLFNGMLHDEQDDSIDSFETLFSKEIIMARFLYMLFQDQKNKEKALL